jgi:DNA-binding response OmpR family regulator
MGNIKTLIVDDEAFIRELIVDFLEGEGFSIVEAASITEAEEKLEADDFDLMLLDWNLNRGNSEELINKLEDRGGEVKVIILTGDHSRSLKGLNSKFVKGIIYKPFQMDDFLNKIEELWSNNEKD